MVPVRDLFESHLTVADLQRSMDFYGRTLGLELAEVFWERRVAFYWIGGRGNSMLGLWEAGTGPQRLSLHLAFKTDLEDLLEAPRASGLPMPFRSTSKESRPTNRWFSRGCPLHRSTSATRMGIYSSCSPCCRMLPNPNWE